MANRLQVWMEKNLEEPFFKAEMARAESSGQDNPAAAKIQFFAAAGIILTVCCLVVSAVR
ncbi:MAG: hypothetical protein JL50_06475 [Peptococcaceae bacterium BICA1-7]|nr:MAG: hypothetical protein JL50_06475 [Peptococcaceae bacterium BICA1-7]HBV99287.1 hypothetical protein [Desulfotomaculum sp.]